MPTDTAHLLVLQCFLIIIPTVVYASGATKELNQRLNVWFSLLMTATLLLCMMVPIKFIDGNQWDLREVPMIIGTLYGGPITAGILYLVFAAFRLSCWGIGTIGALTINGLMMSCLLILAPKFRGYNRNQRMLAATSVSVGAFAILLVYTSTVVHYDTKPFLFMMLLLGFIQSGATAFLTYLFETFEWSRRVRRELERKESEESKIMVDMAASVAHEIRTPLTTAIGFLQFLAEDELDPNKRRDYLMHCLSALRHADQVIAEYLAYANPKEVPREPMDVYQQLMATVNDLRPAAEEQGIDISISRHGAAVVEGNQDQMRMCLRNLCENAIESMPSGGFLRVGTYESVDSVVVQIEDSGHGMTHEQLSRLGKPFYSTKDKGTGLGTMVVYRIIESMSGSVTCESTQREGTRFMIRLPRAQPAKLEIPVGHKVSE